MWQHITVIIFFTLVFRFYLIDVQLNIDSPSQFCVFFLALNYLTLIKASVSEENALKKSKTPSAFIYFFQNYRLNSFNLIENNFRFLK